MSDSDNTKDSFINIKLPDSIDNAVKNLTDKPTATIGDVISDCLFLVFGGIGQMAALKRAKYSFELEHFKTELEEKLNAIPEEKRIEPNMHTICTALDSMRFCVEEKELRDMFATLIANSINTDKEAFVHPSFGEIIKQMTSLDAVIFKAMTKQTVLPVLRLKIVYKSRGQGSLSRNLIWDDWNSIDRVAASLDNLTRLKLIDISYEEFYTDETRYDRLREKKHIAKEFEKLQVFANKFQGKVDFDKGIIRITEFGKNFISACI